MKKRTNLLFLAALTVFGLLFAAGCEPQSKVPVATGTPAQVTPPPEAQAGPPKKDGTDVPPPTQ